MFARFRATTPLSRGQLRSKGHGKLSIHYGADQETIETIFRIIVSANQLSLYRAVAEMCEEYESLHERTVRPDMVMGQSIVFSAIKTEVSLDYDDPTNQDLLLQQYGERIQKLSQQDKLSKNCMDAGFLCVVEIGQYFMTKDTGAVTHFHTVACREITLPREDGSSQTRGWIQGNTKIGPMLEVTTSFLHGKHGVEIRIWSLSGDNTHSWVRISHGSNKFVMDSNNNDIEVPEDQLEEQALKLNAKDIVGQTKAKAKPPRKEPAESSSRIIPMDRRNWIDIEPGNQSLSLCVRSFEESDLSSSSFTESTSRRRWSGSFLENQRKSSESNSHSLFIGLTIDGKHAWQQEEEQKGDISTALMIQE